MNLLAENARPLTEVRRHTSEIFEEVRTTHQALLITEHGRSAGVIMDPESFDLMTRRLEVLEEIAMGEADIAAGNHIGWKELKAGLRKWQR